MKPRASVPGPLADLSGRAPCVRPLPQSQPQRETRSEREPPWPAGSGLESDYRRITFEPTAAVAGRLPERLLGAEEVQFPAAVARFERSPHRCPTVAGC